MKLVKFFDEIDKSMVSDVGGKGANLGEMTRAGFPVPPGFCLTTAAYDSFSEGARLDGLSGEEARAVLAARELPRECREAIREAAESFPTGTLFSVRSSATAEDLAFASFAGQQDTYLNVTTADLADAVKRCFVSLYTDRAVSYRAQNGIDRPSMSVVVQRMVRSDSSGVMFTADPVSGRRKTLVVDAIFGLGEAIVSGLVSPDHVEFDKEEGKVLTRDIACKSFAIRPLPDGGTVREELNSTEPVLSEDQILKVAELGIRLEEHYGSPQDVEWAFEGDELYCLQTRAITSLYPAPEPFEDGKFHFLFNMGYQQMNTKAMPVMALDCLLGAVNLSSPDLFECKPVMGYAVGQHFFVDFSLIIAMKPARKIVLERLLPQVDALAASAITELLGRNKKLARPKPEMVKVLRTAGKNAIHFRRVKDPKAASLEALQTMQERSDDIMATYQSLGVEPEDVKALFANSQMMKTFFADPFMPMVVNGVLALAQLRGLERKMGCEGEWTDDLQIGNEGNVVTEMGLALGDLADLVAANPELQALLAEGGDGLGATLGARTDSFGDAYRGFMRLYGFRGIGELDISQPRYREDPSLLLSQILMTSKGKEPGSHRTEYEEKNARARLAGEELLIAVEEKLGKRQAKKARLLLDRYQSYYPLREHFKHFWMRNLSEAREALLRMGAKLAAAGQIDCAEDIMHLHLKEVYAALGDGADMRSLVEGRKVEFERVSKLTPPRIITSEGEVLMGSLSREGLPEGMLAGVGVSPGVVEGVAKVVLDPRGASVAKGEILVAPFTDPGWTPLFVDAAGVVTEVGGMLTHGAVVAREYGIPGVVSVVDATRIIKTGWRLRVDGTAGIVEMLED